MPTYSVTATLRSGFANSCCAATSFPEHWGGVWRHRHVAVVRVRQHVRGSGSDQGRRRRSSVSHHLLPHPLPPRQVCVHCPLGE